MADRALSLCGIASSKRLAAKEINPLRHRIQMPRVHARRVTAQVVKLQARGDLAAQHLPGCAVRHQIAVSPQADLPVSE
jgi:hypothetical protein